MDSSRNPFLGPRLAWALKKASWSSGSISMSWGGAAAAPNLLCWGIAQDDTQMNQDDLLWLQMTSIQEGSWEMWSAERHEINGIGCKEQNDVNWCHNSKLGTTQKWIKAWLLGQEIKEMGVGSKIAKNAYIADFSLLILCLLVSQLEVAAREHAHLWIIFFRANSLFWLFPTYRLIVMASSDELRNHPLKTESIWNWKQSYNY